jgi:hypothetical protein
MSSGLTSALSDFAKRSEFCGNPLASEPSASGPSDKPSHAPRYFLTGAQSRLGKLVTSAFARHVLAFFVGVAATLVWQSYGGAARGTIAGWSPHLAWLAPSVASSGAASERLKATSLALTAVRQSVEKLGTELGKLQAEGMSAATPSPPSSRRGSRRL